MIQMWRFLCYDVLREDWWKSIKESEQQTKRNKYSESVKKVRHNWKNLGDKNASQISFVSNLRLEFPFSLGTSICMKIESHFQNKTANRFEITRQKDVQMPSSLHTPVFQGFSLSSLCLLSLATQAVGCAVFRYMCTIPLTSVPLTYTGRIETFAQRFKLCKFSLQYLMQCCNLSV